jgi:ornithine carbamoyltransferase
MKTRQAAIPLPSGLRHFLDIDQLDSASLRRLVDSAIARKKARNNSAKGGSDADAPLRGRMLALIFEKPSTRTRVSFTMAMQQLGGSSFVLNGEETQLGRGETIADTAQVLSRYVDGLVLRTSAHDNLLKLAENADVPVINGLTDQSHPCQLIADIMTFEEHCGPIGGRRIAWLGDGNNVAASWIHSAVRFDFELRLACPLVHRPPAALLRWAKKAGGNIMLAKNALQAADGADCVVTDTWFSMGQKKERKRRAALKPYQVNKRVMQAASRDAIFMHCLPAHRGEEVSADVIDGPQSVVNDEAENRLHAQKAILNWCFSATV